MVELLDVGGFIQKKRIPTINTTPVGKSGPLAQFITEDIYVSGVGENNIEYTDDAPISTAEGNKENTAVKTNTTKARNNNQPPKKR